MDEMVENGCSNQIVHATPQLWTHYPSETLEELQMMMMSKHLLFLPSDFSLFLLFSQFSFQPRSILTFKRKTFVPIAFCDFFHETLSQAKKELKSKLQREFVSSSCDLRPFTTTNSTSNGQQIQVIWN